VQHRPIGYTEDATGRREPVSLAYRHNPDGTIGFDIGPYDATRTLIIDPELSFATYLGGEGTDVVGAIAAGADGSTLCRRRYRGSRNGAAGWFRREIRLEGSDRLHHVHARRHLQHDGRRGGKMHLGTASSRQIVTGQRAQRPLPPMERRAAVAFVRLGGLASAEVNVCRWISSRRVRHIVKVWRSSYQPLRLPGQEGREGSEYYNIHRWYRSGWGRYTQSDPRRPGPRAVRVRLRQSNFKVRSARPIDGKFRSDGDTRRYLGRRVPCLRRKKGYAQRLRHLVRP
jgi:hypothetical protein